MLKVAIVGCGGISRSHLNSWKQIPEAKIVGACDVRAEKYQVFVDETGWPMTMWTLCSRSANAILWTSACPPTCTRTTP